MACQRSGQEKASREQYIRRNIPKTKETEIGYQKRYVKINKRTFNEKFENSTVSIRPRVYCKIQY